MAKVLDLKCIPLTGAAHSRDPPPPPVVHLASVKTRPVKLATEEMICRSSMNELTECKSLHHIHAGRQDGSYWQDSSVSNSI